METVMPRSWTSLALAMLLLELPRTAVSQAPPGLDSLAPGDHVRLTVTCRVDRGGRPVECAPARRPQTVVGTMAAWRADSVGLTLSRGDASTVARDWITRAEVARGTRSRTGQGAAIGLLAGALAGVVIGSAAMGDDPYAGVGGLMGAGVGAAAGLLIGAAVGSSLHAPRWIEVRAP